MYTKDKPISLKGSTSALYNNLSVAMCPGKGITTYAVVHKAVVNLVGVSNDGFTINHRQVVCREPQSTHNTTIVLQAKLVQLPARSLLIIVSQVGMQMYEADTSLLIYWHAFGDGKSSGSGGPQTCFGRGICGVGDDIVCVGDYRGSIHVFSVPRSGTTIVPADTIHGHKYPICALASEDNLLVSSDDVGRIIVWQQDDDSFTNLVQIQGDGAPATTLGLWQDLVVCGYSSGHIRLFNINSGLLIAEATAHARWVTALDVSHDGLVVTASEDSFVRVWQLTGGHRPNLEHKFGECVTDVQLQGANFTSKDGTSFAVTGYDSNDLIFFRQN